MAVKNVKSTKNPVEAATESMPNDEMESGMVSDGDIVAGHDQEDEEAQPIEEPSDAATSAPGTAVVLSSARSVARTDLLQRYLMDVRRYPLLSREEEHDLAVKYAETQDSQYAHLLVTSNLRLVVKIANDYQKYWMNLLDLVQEGNVGLMQAVKHYDPYRGVKLSSYSSFWIKAYILKFIIDNWSLVKIGTTQAQRKLFFNLKKEHERFAQLGYDPDASRIAKSLNVKQEVVEEMQQRMAGGDLSLDQPLGDDSEESHLDMLAGREQDISDHLADVEVRDLFRSKIASFQEKLAEKERYIFEKRLMAEQPETLNQIGERFGVSRERIRQLEERLIKRLRDYFREEVPDLSDFAVERPKD